MSHEKFKRSEYDIVEQKESAFVKGHVSRVKVGIRCPACGNELPVINHGESKKCRCGLTLNVWGNSIFLGHGEYNL